MNGIINMKFTFYLQLTINFDWRELSTPDLCDLVEEFIGYSTKNTELIDWVFPFYSQTQVWTKQTQWKISFVY